ncbi:MAG: helix-turn-helix domain-containing protein [Devosia sp.]|nr:helix-turn-helix domain-containing protein [Devosia sp.]
MTEPIAYTLPDFLKRFGVSRSTAYREINSGRLEARKRGSRTIITSAAAQACSIAFRLSNPSRSPKATLPRKTPPLAGRRSETEK